MAGDWMKVELATVDKPETYELARILGCHHDRALGMCVRFWAWANAATDDGILRGMRLEDVDAIVRRKNFGGALVKVGWLSVEKNVGLTIPNFDRHNPQSAGRLNGRRGGGRG